VSSLYDYDGRYPDILSMVPASYQRCAYISRIKIDRHLLLEIRLMRSEIDNVRRFRSYLSDV
jgi:hypothetical protein